jgi:voltage-gated potassium channel Kch
LITSAIVLSFLSLHGFTSRKIQHSGDHPNRDIHTQVRVSGRHFMLSTTLFLFLVGLTALIMSRIEGWSYLDGIYYSTVTFETIGFGDFSPTHPASQVLVIPLGLIGIASLGSLVQMIVSFFSERSAARKEKSRAIYEKQRQKAEDEKQDPANLDAEIEFLESLNRRQDVKDQAWEFAMVSSILKYDSGQPFDDYCSHSLDLSSFGLWAQRSSWHLKAGDSGSACTSAMSSS